MTPHQEEILLFCVAIEDCIRDSVLQVARKFTKFPAHVRECVFRIEKTAAGEEIHLQSVIVVEKPEKAQEVAA